RAPPPRRRPASTTWRSLPSSASLSAAPWYSAMRNGRRICRRYAGSREAREQAEPEDPCGDGAPERGSAGGGPADAGSQEVETLDGTRFLSTAPRMPLTNRLESASP